MSLNVGSSIKSWNYTRPDKPNYTAPDANGQQSIIATIVSMQEIQGRKYNPNGGPGLPDTFDNGDPRFNIRIGLALPNGNLVTFTFAKAGAEQKERKKPSVHMTLSDLCDDNMLSLIGKTIQITTWPQNPTTGQAWGLGNPRLFDIQFVDAGPYTPINGIPVELTYEKILCNNGASGGQPIPATPATIVTPTVQPVAQVQPVATQQAVVQPVVTQPTIVAQPAVATMQPQMPAGIDPNIAAAMQQLGTANVQEVFDNEVYTDIPF